MTENDILNTLEEIYNNEEVSDKDIIITKDQSKSDIIINNVLTPEFDNNCTVEIPTVFTQLTKRKSTVLNSEKQIVSGLVIGIKQFILLDI